MDEAARLQRDAQALGVRLDAAQCAAMQRLLDELGEWSQRYNLTAITTREGMITRHLLDSLSVLPFLHGTRIADLGTGAGFPGLPLAIADAARQFTLVDATAKKIRFVAHAVSVLGLGNVDAFQSRIEALPAKPPFDSIVARALAPLPQLLELIRPLCGPATHVVAMLGRRPDAELAALPAGWRLVRVDRVIVPALEAERHVAVFTR
jgi:16S rRNA (guanine527-N7)-methyltransferase